MAKIRIRTTAQAAVKGSQRASNVIAAGKEK